MQMMQSECENNFTKEVPKGDPTGDKISARTSQSVKEENPTYRGSKYMLHWGTKIHEGRDYPFHLGKQTD